VTPLADYFPRHGATADLVFCKSFDSIALVKVQYHRVRYADIALASSLGGNL